MVIRLFFERRCGQAHRYDYRDGYPPNPNQTEPVLVSGHGYSQDGVNWGFNDEAPYEAKITFENG